MARALVTGATGDIGSRLVLPLLSAGMAHSILREAENSTITEGDSKEMT